MAPTEPTGHTRDPTAAQRKQERALRLVVWLDVLTLAPYLTVGIAAGSPDGWADTGFEEAPVFIREHDIRWRHHTGEFATDLPGNAQAP